MSAIVRTLPAPRLSLSMNGGGVAPFEITSGPVYGRKGPVPGSWPNGNSKSVQLVFRLYSQCLRLWSVSADCGERGEEKSLPLLKTRNAIENLEFRDLRPYRRGMVTILRRRVRALDASECVSTSAEFAPRAVVAQPA